MGCWSCGPALGAPSCKYSKYRCGDRSCGCAVSPDHEDPPDYDSYADELDAEETFQ
jgi:hypothetical protein